MRLQIETRMGAKLMEYVWPERRRRKEPQSPSSPNGGSRTRRVTEAAPVSRALATSRTSMDSPRITDAGRSLELTRLAAPPLRRMATSRSFTDLRSATKDRKRESNLDYEQERAPDLRRGFSSHALPAPATPGLVPGDAWTMAINNHVPSGKGDAEEMKTRSAQKSFVLVRVPRSVH
jgi:hypothetical protein